MSGGLAGWKPVKKNVWDYREIPDDPSVHDLMPGFEIQYMVTGDTVPDNENAVFGHCIFPPKSAHGKHQHLNASEIMYTIRGKVVVGYTTPEGDVEKVCSPGTAAFVPKGVVCWVRNPFEDEAEFVFAYFGCNSLDTSGYVEARPPSK